MRWILPLGILALALVAAAWLGSARAQKDKDVEREQLSLAACRPVGASTPATGHARRLSIVLRASGFSSR